MFTGQRARAVANPLRRSPHAWGGRIRRSGNRLRFFRMLARFPVLHGIAVPAISFCSAPASCRVRRCRTPQAAPPRRDRASAPRGTPRFFLQPVRIRPERPGSTNPGRPRGRRRSRIAHTARTQRAAGPHTREKRRIPYDRRLRCRRRRRLWRPSGARLRRRLRRAGQAAHRKHDAREQNRSVSGESGPGLAATLASSRRESGRFKCHVA